MAIAIAPTPILRDKDAVNFTRRVKEGLKNPVSIAPTPRIETARNLVDEYLSTALVYMVSKCLQ